MPVVVAEVVVGTATAIALTLVAGLTARPPAHSVPDRGGYFVRWAALHGGYDPRRSRFAGGWLTGVYRVGRPLAQRGVQPDVLTGWGLWAALVVVALAVPPRLPLLAAAVVVGSAWADNLDGCVAVLTDRVTRFGYVLDSVVDRLADAAYLVALWRLGCPGALAVAAGGALGLLEYTRARAGNAGMGEIGLVTVGERPTRVIVVTLALLGAGLFPERHGVIAAVGAGTIVGVCLIGLGQLLTVTRRLLG